MSRRQIHSRGGSPAFGSDHSNGSGADSLTGDRSKTAAAVYPTITAPPEMSRITVSRRDHVLLSMANKRLQLLAFITLALILSIGPATADAAPCDSLAKLTLANTTITNAQLVPTGAFHLPSGRRPRASVEMFSDFDRLPMFCRVQAIVAPSRDSRIRVEVWLPVTGWNGRYLGVGNGGYAGSLSYFRLGEGVNPVVARGGDVASDVFSVKTSSAQSSCATLWHVRMSVSALKYFLPGASAQCRSTAGGRLRRSGPAIDQRPMSTSRPPPDCRSRFARTGSRPLPFRGRYETGSGLGP